MGSSINVFLWILPNALLISRSGRYTVLSLANTCSVVDLFLQYPAWDMGIAEPNLKLIFLYIQTANVFIRTNKKNYCLKI